MPDKDLVSIIIPVYKENITSEERISLRQCLKVLKRYRKVLVTWCGLNLDVYFAEYPDFKVEYFDKKFFRDVDCYNCLMLSKLFYERFTDYKYILIYQLDAYVFRDELEYWCSLNYDYLGAPWFEDFQSFEDGMMLWAVGNGGFSLRKVSALIRVLNYKGAVKKPFAVIRSLNSNNSVIKIKKILISFLMIFGYKNNIWYLLNNYNRNEDNFWRQFTTETNMVLKIPSPELAASFSFEKSPEYLFNKIGNKLPFGCHGWSKYSYNTFWEKYISEK